MADISHLSLRKKLAFVLAVAFIAFTGGLVVAEGLLRLLPIPGITYHTFYWDEVTGGRYYPKTTMMYRNERGDYVERRVNSWGFLDKNHDEQKPPDTIRIGFFGDSYTVAKQVELDQTFFRRIEEGLNAGGGTPRYECLTFAASGRGTLQSYLECGQWMDRVGLDWVVYVFAENDLGDQVREIKRTDTFPYPVAEGDSFSVDYSFREHYGYKGRRLHRLQQFVKSNSLVVSTVEGRLKLLKRRGIKTRVTDDERYMAERGDKGSLPRSGNAPSSWPDTLITKAEDLGQRVLGKWVREVKASGRRFLVVHIPRQREMGKPKAQQDTWAAWIDTQCAQLDVQLIDPSVELLRQLEVGREVFYDHLTPAGHNAVAKTFIDMTNAPRAEGAMMRSSR